MKTLCMAVLMMTALGLGSLPASAQESPGGNGPVAGVGPGGSGAGQSSLGPSKAFLRARHHPRRHRRR